MVVEPTTRDFRLERKAVKDLISNTPDGINVDELARLAEMKGISGDDFQNVLKSLLNSGRAYYDDLGKIRYVRTE
jgi:DNA replicative helicase MCM subunit Mcm2 (Cdc46/Mcm family)